MSSQYPVAFSVLVACLAIATHFIPVPPVSACVGVDGAAVAVTASMQPASLRMQAGRDCTVLFGEGAHP